jgi:hypothetical protein
MTFAAYEKSRQKGRPVNLFYVKYGDSPGSYLAYTDAEQAITKNGIKYMPLAIDRGKIAVSGKLDKAALEVRATLNTPMAELFRVYPPASVVNITVMQGHVNDPDAQFLVVWTGRVISAKRTDNELVLTCEPISTTLKRIALRRHYQYSCMHVLYGSECRANKAAATTHQTVMGTVNNTVTLPAGWASDDFALKYIGGMIEWTNSAGDLESRTILRVVNTNTVLVTGFIRDLKVGDPIDVILGCNHGFYMNADKNDLDVKTDCYYLHDNIHNYGGCPWIPTKNPVGQLNNYY